MPLKVLDVFSGVGGFSLGLERAGMQTIAFCEIDPFCRRVLAKHWPGVPIHEDIRELDGTQYRGTADVVCGGFPCQPFSSAGERSGEAHDSFLWPEMVRVVRESQPAWVIGENVDGFIGMGLDDCASDLEAIGYEVWPVVVPACAVGALHRRSRVWILGYANSDRKPNVPGDGTEASWLPQDARALWPEYSAKAFREADGLSHRLDRLRSLGNAVVPQIPEMIGRAIMQASQALSIARDV